MPVCYREPSIGCKSSYVIYLTKVEVLGKRVWPYATKSFYYESPQPGIACLDCSLMPTCYIRNLSLHTALWNVYLNRTYGYTHSPTDAPFHKHTPVCSLRSDGWKVKRVVPARNLWYGCSCVCHPNKGRFSQIHQLLMAHIPP